MKLIAITITAYLTGYLVFLTGNFVFDKYHEWDRAWFIWNNVANAGILFWVTLYKLAPPSLKKYVRAVCVFGIIIPLWQMAAVIAGISWNNPVAVGITFFVLIGVITYFLFKGFIRLYNYLDYE